jgi:hypothetical protein
MAHAIDLRVEDGTTAPLVPAYKIWKLHITYLRIVATHTGSGTQLPTGSEYLTYNQQPGHLSQPHSNGGSSYRHDRTFHVKLLTSSCFPSIGKFGKREIVELHTYIVPYTYTCN